MQITDIRIRLIDNPEAKLKAVAAITFDSEFVVHDVKIVVGSDGGLFVAMPSRKTPEGEFKDICHPIKPSFREYLSKEILLKYDLMI